MANFTITGSITIGGTYNGLTITNGSITGGTFNGVTLDNNAWTTYVPVIAAGTGTFTTVSATGRYKQIGKTVFVQISINITTNGSAASFITATLPVVCAANNYFIGGRENAIAGYALSAVAESGSSMFIQKYDATYPGGDGALLQFCGVYEAA